MEELKEILKNSIDIDHKNQSNDWWCGYETCRDLVLEKLDEIKIWKI